mmetsp:Transcript_6526/g.10388  ORF Transcript_6526/g.10388 Transcript_6526/m.10388 type:complete len:130 (+) Transcript_6526:158-547(+)
MRHSEVDQMDWVSTEKEVKDSQQRIDEKDFRAMLMSISKADAQRAALILTRFLSNKVNANVRAVVLKNIAKSTEQEVDKETATANRIVDGIRESIAFHTKDGTRPTSSETFVSNILTGCLIPTHRSRLR